MHYVVFEVALYKRLLNITIAMFVKLFRSLRHDCVSDGVVAASMKCGRITYFSAWVSGRVWSCEEGKSTRTLMRILSGPEGRKVEYILK